MTQTMTVNKGLTGTGLKWIAMATMLIDHVGATVLQRYMAENAEIFGIPAGTLYFISRMIGRVAFPIFCFLLVEGFLHTHDPFKYFKNLMIFAFVSEIPFDLAINGTVLEFHSQNVFFTLAIGLAAMWLVDHFKGKKLLQFVCVSACAIFSQMISTDYGACGVILIIIFYTLRNRHDLMFFIGGLWLFFGLFLQSMSEFLLNSSLSGYPVDVILMSSLSNGMTEVLGAFSFIWITKYNGQRGKSLPKYLFYAFYPGHLLLLAGISRLVATFIV